MIKVWYNTNNELKKKRNVFYDQNFMNRKWNFYLSFHNEPIRCCDRSAAAPAPAQQDVGRIHFVFFGLGNKYLEEVKNKCILEFSLAKWGEMPSNSRTWRRLSYFKILRIHLVGKKKGRKGKKKKKEPSVGVVVVDSLLSWGSIGPQRILIKQHKSLLALSHCHIPSSLRFFPCCPRGRKKKKKKPKQNL